MDNIIPCGNCKERHLYCHDDCPHYLDWKKTGKIPSTNYDEHRDAKKMREGLRISKIKKM